MMDSMVNFTTAFLEAVASFLGSEPIIYLFGLFCLVVVIKAVRIIL